MFIWDLGALCAIILILAFGVVITRWVTYTFSEDVVNDKFIDEMFFKQCQYCGYVYMDYFRRNPPRCPRCLSYHDS